MPTVVNGIGTWYYGKRRIHKRKGNCEFCGNQATLSSYDTTLFFVVLFVPLFPLSRKRILEQCSVCERHRVLSLAKWEEIKVQDGARVFDDLHNHPEDRESILNALAFTQSYQDEPLFIEVVEPLAREVRNDALIQSQLGEAYAYFSRWPHAEMAFRASLAVQDDVLVRERLAWALLKQGRPREARPLLQHIIDQRIQDAAGMNYFLIKGYQAEGLHDEALALMDERDAAFPEFVNLKEYQKQRKASTRYRGTEKRVGSSFLLEAGRTGYRQGNWTARIPLIITALIFLGAIGAYLGSAAWIGMARKVYLVNGTGQPYTVLVGDSRHTIPPLSSLPVRVAEGDVEVAFADPKLKLGPARCRIETSFWTRPFADHTFVINPDQSALVVWEEAFYARANPPRGKALEINMGKPYYQFSGLDYEFQNFPPTIPVKGDQAVRKTRVALFPIASNQIRFKLMMQKVAFADQDEYCKRLLALDPNNSLFLYYLQTRLPADQMLAFLQGRLDDRPIRVEWHRAYQSLMEKTHPETDLRPRYEKLMTEMKESPDAVYLLGRIQPDLDKGDALFLQAAAGDAPSGYALYALGYRALGEGRFADAARLLEKSLPLLSEKFLVRPLYHEALLAAKDYDGLLRILQGETAVEETKPNALQEIVRVHAIRGDRAQTQSALEGAVENVTFEKAKVRHGLEMMVCCCENNPDGFLNLAAADPAPYFFEAALLRGQLKEAAALAHNSLLDANIDHGLMYLAGVKNGAKELADNHFKILVEKLEKGLRQERLLADLLTGKKSLASHPAQKLNFELRAKRVFLAVLAQRNPEQAREILDLARLLDYHHDPISLCLRKYWPEGKK